MIDMPPLEDQLFAFLRVALAGAIGAVLGWEREKKDRPAGLRTHIAVGMAAALIMSLADLMIAAYPDGASTRIDPTRVLEAVVGGVTFLGAGTIIVHRDAERVHGLTTAAGLLVTATLGVAAGLGAYVLAIGAAGATLGVLALSRAFGPGSEHHSHETE
jgi:putative Mg2+ transporter-C (MgtC) family protein